MTVDHDISSTASSMDTQLTRSIWLLFTIAVAILLTCLHLIMTSPFELNSFDRLADLDAVEPFQHRILLPMIVAAMRTVLPVHEKLLFGLFEVGFWVALLQLFGLALAQFHVALRPFDRRLLSLTVVIPVLMHLIMPDVFMKHQFIIEDGELALGDWRARELYYYVYDLPAAVFTLALVLLLARLQRQPHSRRLWMGYWLLFAIATLNRETTVFVIPLAGVMLWQAQGQRLMATSRLLTLHGLMFLVLQGPLHWLFADHTNPAANMGAVGGQYEQHLLENLLMLARPLYLIFFLARFTAGAYIPILLWWQYIDKRLGQVLLIFTIPAGIVALAAGRLMEHRIFIELIPLVWLAALQIIVTRRRAEPGHVSRAYVPVGESE